MVAITAMHGGTRNPRQRLLLVVDGTARIRRWLVLLLLVVTVIRSGELQKDLVQIWCSVLIHSYDSFAHRYRYLLIWYSFRQRKQKYRSPTEEFTCNACRIKQKPFVQSSYPHNASTSETFRFTGKRTGRIPLCLSV